MVNKPTNNNNKYQWQGRRQSTNVEVAPSLESQQQRAFVSMARRGQRGYVPLIFSHNFNRYDTPKRSLSPVNQIVSAPVPFSRSTHINLNVPRLQRVMLSGSRSTEIASTE